MPTTGSHVHINSKEKLAQLKLDPDQLLIHSFTKGKHGRGPLSLALSNDNQTVYVLDLGSLEQKDVAQALKPFITQKTKLVGYDVKSSLQVLLELGLPLPQVEHDVQIGNFLLYPLERDQSLTAIATNHLDYEGSGFENLTPDQMAGCEPEIIAIIKTLYDKQKAELKNFPKMASLARDVELPIIPVLAKMEYLGIQLDTKYLEKFAGQINDLISNYEQQIYGHADQEFNIGSPSQLADVLFNKLKLSTAGIKKGKSGYSTAATELDKLRGLHPIIDLITQFRGGR